MNPASQKGGSKATSPSPEEELALATRRQYITNANINAMIAARNLRVNLMIAQMDAEILPDTAAYLRREFLSMATMFEPKQETTQ